MCVQFWTPTASTLFSCERRGEVSGVKKLSKKYKRRLKLQAQLLDVILDMQNEAERRDEIHNLNRILRNFRGLVSAPNKKLRNYFWDDMLTGFDVLLTMSRREDEIHNIGRLVKVTKKLHKL